MCLDENVIGLLFANLLATFVYILLIKLESLLLVKFYRVEPGL